MRLREYLRTLREILWARRFAKRLLRWQEMTERIIREDPWQMIYIPTWMNYNFDMKGFQLIYVLKEGDGPCKPVGRPDLGR